MTLMGRVFDVLLHQDFVEFLGCLVPLLLVVNACVFFFAISTLPNIETKQGKNKARSCDLVSKNWSGAQMMCFA